jgi:beta-glucosidase
MFRKTFPLYSKLIIAIYGILWARVGIAQAVPAYLDSSQPTAKRVDDLVRRMTLEEKVSQMQNQAVAIPRLNVPAYNW